VISQFTGKFIFHQPTYSTLHIKFAEDKIIQGAQRASQRYNGQWTRKMYVASKRRLWRKIHIVVLPKISQNRSQCINRE